VFGLAWVREGACQGSCLPRGEPGWKGMAQPFAFDELFARANTTGMVSTRLESLYAPLEELVISAACSGARLTRRPVMDRKWFQSVG
jgi:hypothetical protein